MNGRRWRIAFLVSALSLNSCVALVPFIVPDVTIGPDGRAQKAEADCVLSGEPIDVALHYFAPSEQKPQPPEVKLPEVKKPAPSLAERRAQKISLLVSQLRDRSAVVRTHAASDLGSLGSLAQGAIRPLAYALEHDSSKWVRRAAARSLGKIGNQDAVPPLRRALRDRNPWVAHSAENALKRISH